MNEPVITATTFSTDISQDRVVFHLALSAKKANRYSFMLKLDGLQIERTLWSSEVETTFIREDKGCYQLVFLAKNDEGKTAHKASELIWHIPQVTDWAGAGFSENWLRSQNLSDISLGEEYKFLTKEEPKDGRILVLDFLDEAFKCCPSRITALRELEDPFSVPADPDITRYHELVKTKIDTAISSYGSGNVVVLAPLYQFNCADTQQKNINWMLEEAYDLLRRTDGIHVISLPHCQTSNIITIPVPSDKDAESSLSEFRVLMRKKYSGELGIPQTKVSLEGNLLKVVVENDLPPEACWGRLDLMLDGQVIDRCYQFTLKTPFTWKLEKPGIYVVQTHLMYLDQSTYGQSEALFFSNDESEKEYQMFLENKPEDKDLLGQGLFYTQATPPLFDFLIVSSNKEIEQAGKLKQSICNTHAGFHCESIGKYGDWSTTLLTDGTVSHHGDFSVLLAGCMILDGVLINDVNELPVTIEKNQFDSQYGEYSAVYWDRDYLRISMDLYRLFHIYQYAAEGLHLYSNNYLLLLEAIQALQLPCSLDIDKACVTLGTPGFQPLLQNFSHCMDISPIRKVPFQFDPILSASGWDIAQTELGNVLTSQETFHEENYRRSLKNALDEMKTVITAYFDHSNYDYFVIPLSGGLDSRLLFSVAYLINHRKPIFVDCWDINTPGGIGDWTIGTSICGFLNHPYDTESRSLYCLSLHEEDARIRGLNVGSYYAHDLGGMNSLFQRDNYLVFIGAGGEIATRPIIAPRYYDAPKSIQNDVDPLVLFILSHMMHNVLVPSRDAFDNFHVFWSKAMKTLPDMSAYERLDRHYMEWRHGIHFGRRRWLSFPVALPMQSKTMLRLHHLTFNLFKSLRLNLDLIYLANPSIAQFPFEKPKDNQKRDRLMEDLVVQPEKIPEVDLELGEDVERWRASRSLRDKKALLTGQMTDIPPDKINQLLLTSCNNILWHLLDTFPELEARIGPALYHSLTHRKLTSQEINYLYNKLVSLYDQTKILKGDSFQVLRPGLK